ncbi:hypothetical protein [Calothrix sp. CCY 0018]|uniref:hypothetical protein n=1 Tax=Calothrix sp. CCY 0018 TaxID=3103864 RepID=UPI0039C75299
MNGREELVEELNSSENKKQEIELMTLISQINNQQKDNLLTILKFLIACESFKDNQRKDTYKIIEKQYYASLVAFVNQRNFKIELNIPDFLDMNKIFNNIMSTATQIDLLRYFRDLTAYEQKNLLNIVKFVYNYQKNQVNKEPMRDIAHRYWNNYIDLTQKLKSLLIDENIQ